MTLQELMRMYAGGSQNFNEATGQSGSGYIPPQLHSWGLTDTAGYRPDQMLGNGGSVQLNAAPGLAEMAAHPWYSAYRKNAQGQLTRPGNDAGYKNVNWMTGQPTQQRDMGGSSMNMTGQSHPIGAGMGGDGTGFWR